MPWWCIDYLSSKQVLEDFNHLMIDTSLPEQQVTRTGLKGLISGKTNQRPPREQIDVCGECVMVVWHRVIDPEHAHTHITVIDQSGILEGWSLVSGSAATAARCSSRYRPRRTSATGWTGRAALRFAAEAPAIRLFAAPATASQLRIQALPPFVFSDLRVTHCSLRAGSLPATNC
jgi:hypothetical protein